MQPAIRVESVRIVKYLGVAVLNRGRHAEFIAGRDCVGAVLEWRVGIPTGYAAADAVGQSKC